MMTSNFACILFTIQCFHQVVSSNPVTTDENPCAESDDNCKPVDEKSYYKQCKINCSDYNRLEGSQCVTRAQDCGDCMPGFTETEPIKEYCILGDNEVWTTTLENVVPLPSLTTHAQPLTTPKSDSSNLGSLNIFLIAIPIVASVIFLIFFGFKMYKKFKAKTATAKNRYPFEPSAPPESIPLQVLPPLPQIELPDNLNNDRLPQEHGYEDTELDEREPLCTVQEQTQRPVITRSHSEEIHLRAVPINPDEPNEYASFPTPSSLHHSSSTGHNMNQAQPPPHDSGFQSQDNSSNSCSSIPNAAFTDAGSESSGTGSATLVPEDANAQDCASETTDFHTAPESMSENPDFSDAQDPTGENHNACTSITNSNNNRIEIRFNVHCNVVRPST